MHVVRADPTDGGRMRVVPYTVRGRVPERVLSRPMGDFRSLGEWIADAHASIEVLIDRVHYLEAQVNRCTCRAEGEP